MAIAESTLPSSPPSGKRPVAAALSVPSAEAIRVGGTGVSAAVSAPASGQREHGAVAPAWLRRLVASPTGAAGLVLVAFHVLAALLAPVLAPYSPTEFHVQDKLLPPSAEYWLGTDQYGRDVLSRVLYGGRSALVVAAGATMLGLLLGGAAGLSAAYFGGKVDELLMRTADALLSFPSLLLAMLVLTMVGPAMHNLVIGIAVVFSPRVARVMRSVALGIREKEFVEAARLRGESSVHIMTREILPNALAPMVVEGSIRLSYAILLVGTLGFLGLGVQPPSPDWGLAVSEARNFIGVAPWLVLVPSVAIASAVIGANLLADGVHRAVDPAAAGTRR